ncbi:DUF2254 domain-containing protein [Aequorivita capsosiphonis]|uniref:DUF2254 domain-containing protein n=1 Tax=Aequorivita capsosiphonis TaxID=487317 RepID=UPI000425D1B9|nr:DUF2254 domain-containing protein [Aequorivita capsosiphonis]
MKQFIVRISTFFSVIKGNIAFYPTLFAIFGFAFSLLMIVLEQDGVSRKIIKIFPLLMVEDGSTAINLMNTCVGGLISMMVFSFSMVMLLLSQASSNFSPRLLPGLISDKKHQIILGIFLASIVYNIFTLFSIEPSEEKYTLPGFSILLGVFFTIVCLSAFIFFIHNISQSIQINNIMDGIYMEAINRLNKIVDAEEKSSKMPTPYFPDTSNWHKYSSPKSGYFQNISIENIADICKKNDVRVYVTIPKGIFINKNNSILKTDKLLEEDIVKNIFSNINFARGEYIGDNYILAFKQITEIAVKAMSPGINDPGTTINAIDYLTELFALRMKKNDSGVVTYNGERHVKIAIIQFKELLYNVMASLRTYCKHDPIVMQKLILMLKYLAEQNVEDTSYKEAINEELEVLIDGMDFDSDKDVQVLRKLAGMERVE